MSSEWTVDGRTWLSEKLRAVLGDVQTVFESNTELAVDGDHRLVAEAHAGLQRRLVAANEVRPFVAVETDAVAGTVGKTWHFVVRAETRVGDHFARRGVDRLTRHAGLRGVERGHLCALLEVPHVDLTLRRFAKHHGARDVRLIAIHHAAVVDLDDVAFLQFLRRDADVGKGGVFAEAGGNRRTLRAERAVRREDVVPEIALRHAFAKRCESRLVGRERHVVGALHQRNLGGRLDRPASSGDRIGADVVECRRFFLDAVEDEEAKAFFNADAAGRHTAILENLGDETVGTVVLLPRPDVFAERNQLTRSRFLECWTDPRQLAFRRDHGDERPLAQAPADAREIEQARSSFEVDGADVVLGHQPPRLVETAQPLRLRDRYDAVRHRTERADGRRDLAEWCVSTSAAWAIGRALGAGEACRECGAADAGCRRPSEKPAAVRVHRGPWTCCVPALDGGATERTRVCGRRLRSTAVPSFQTAATLRMLPMSASGSAASTKRSARLPGSIVPNSSRPRAAIAPLRVAATIA